MEYRKMVQMNVFVKQKETQTQRIDAWLSRQGGRGGMDWEIGIHTHTLLCITQITNENLLCSTGNSMLHGNLNGKGDQGKGGTFIYVADSFYCTAETNPRW